LDVRSLTALLADAGFVAAGEEAQELVDRAGGDAELLEGLVARRLTGEPLAWIVGGVTFCEMRIGVDPGVYVPRWHSEPLALRAVERLPTGGTAVEICCGSGAIARTLMAHRPGAKVSAIDVDARAVACARSNGVDAYLGDMLTGLPTAFGGAVDVIVGVVPYVPAPEMALLQRDTLRFESPLAYDGGPDGLSLLRRAVREAAALLREGATLLLELGAGQEMALADELAAAGFIGVQTIRDADGDIRGIESTLGESPGVRVDRPSYRF
jgi:release factor glutamine methyltransferase